LARDRLPPQAIGRRAPNLARGECDGGPLGVVGHVTDVDDGVRLENFGEAAGDMLPGLSGVFGLVKGESEAGSAGDRTLTGAAGSAAREHDLRVARLDFK
jgi:hypothetical protein